MTIIHGDSLQVLRLYPENFFDSIVTDPPYGLSFMGKRWDYDVPSVELWAECLRVLKPGGHLLAFAGTRTQHRMAVRIEDAGFEIRDMIAWVYGSGFPKSHNGEWGGTALKPALEPVTMARKPLVGTVEANWREHGTGALNIDGCRVELDPTRDDPRLGGKGSWSTDKAAKNVYEGGYAGQSIESSPLGRWPANLIHDGSEEVLAAFPQTAPAKAGMRGTRDGVVYGGGQGLGGENTLRGHIDNGGSAARFFYCAKASKRDRGEGNTHPTVKPADLMRYLCRLVTPPGGHVLDPFAGSGSTIKAAHLEGFQATGIELNAEYVEIAKTRSQVK